MLRIFAFILLCLPVTASAKPGTPISSAPMGEISFGIFCTIEVTGQAEAPGTASGFIHKVDDAPGFDWPGQRTVPASLGIAFGVKAQTVPGQFVTDAEMRVFRPDQPQPDIWTSSFYDDAPSFAFFRFDTEAELVPGLWSFEAWNGDKRLYRVEFDVVPADQAVGIASACGGVS